MELKNVLTTPVKTAACAASAAMMSCGVAEAQEINAAHDSARITTALQIDANVKAGSSDSAGDRKILSGAYRTNEGVVIGVETGIITPQFSQTDSYDTAHLAVSLGYEQAYREDAAHYGVYASAGVLNGPVLDGWHDTVKALHGGTARQSPASSAGKVFAGVALREDRHFPLASIAGASVKLHSALAVLARTDKAVVTAGGFVSLGSADHQFKPNIDSLPVDHQKGFSVYGGLLASGRLYDQVTDRLNTRFAQVTGVAGLSVRFKGLTLRGEAQQDFLSEIKNPQSSRPVRRYMAGIGFEF